MSEKDYEDLNSSAGTTWTLLDPPAFSKVKLALGHPKPMRGQIHWSLQQ